MTWVGRSSKPTPAAPPDFAAIGITADDIPTPLSAVDYVKLMQDPVLAEMFAAQTEMLDENAMQAMIEDPEF